MPDIIDELKGLDDAALTAKLGFTRKLAEAREGLDKMAALEGKAREEAASRVQRMFEPNVYPDEFKWIAEDAVRHAARSAVDEMNDGSPCCLGPRS